MTLSSASFSSFSLLSLPYLFSPHRFASLACLLLSLQFESPVFAKHVEELSVVRCRLLSSHLSVFAAFIPSELNKGISKFVDELVGMHVAPVDVIAHVLSEQVTEFAWPLIPKFLCDGININFCWDSLHIMREDEVAGVNKVTGHNTASQENHVQP